ncbi:SpoIIE family protein phosphatase [Streptomyces sp. NPDC002889]|uniref:SpoIIE family protein phosphatase n=1 Tax=Streptomyces sp. NPDC002889 TaxID=3364669 RepID=UPI0036787927
MTEVGFQSWPSGLKGSAGGTTSALPSPARRTDEPGARDTGTDHHSSNSLFQPSAGPVQAGFFCWDVATGEINCDPPTFHLHGLPEGSPPHLDSFLSRIPESDLPEFVDALQSMAEAGGNYQIAYRIAAGEGVWRSLEARGRVLADAAGVPTRMVGVVMDTTAAHERQEAEKRRLYEGATRNRRMQQLTAALAAAVTVKDIMAATEVGLQDFGASGLAVVASQRDGLSVVASCGFHDEELAAVCDADTGAGSLLQDALGRDAPVFVASVTDLAAAYLQPAQQAAEGSRRRAWAAIPMADSRGPIGVCLMGFPSPQEFGPEEQALLAALAGLLAQSLERAGMYESQHALATELQRGILPPGPLSAPGLTIAARYQAATSGMWIGGDWYDAICLPDGAVALVIGDVQGHSVHAASLMGKLRTAIHAYACEGHGPAAVLARTNRLLVEFDPDPDRAMLATCCYLLIRPAEGTLEACTAGHLAPALIAPGEPPRLLDIAGGLPLGVDPQAQYPTERIPVLPGSVLAVTTDGLLEAAGGDIGVAVEAFLARLAGAATADLEVLADELLAGVQRAPRRSDDIALLLARLTGPPAR